MKFWRRNSFPAKPPAPLPAAPETEAAPVPVDDIPVKVDRDMVELAKAIVRNPAFDVVCRHLRKAEWDLFATTRPEDTAIREGCYLRISALDDIVMKLGDMGQLDPSTGLPIRLTKPKQRT